jgi:hypothetical protein
VFVYLHDTATDDTDRSSTKPIAGVKPELAGEDRGTMHIVAPVSITASRWTSSDTLPSATFWTIAMRTTCGLIAASPGTGERGIG